MERTVAALSAGVVLALVSIGAAGVRWNGTESAPLGVWRVVERSAARGDWVSFCPPANPLFEQYRQRGYIHAGPCGGFERLLKPIVAVPGDVVDVSADGVAVNGRLLPGTAPRRRDGRGRPLEPRLVSHVRVADGELWVVSAHSPLSVDSRYFGPIEARWIEGVALPVWVGS